jgi:general stress protein YciG
LEVTAVARRQQEQGEITVSEAGRRGGEATRRKYGPEFYEEIGKKGGEAVKREYGAGFYEEIGRKGGQKVRRLVEEGKRAGGR